MDDPELQEHGRVDKNVMSALHKLMFDVLHKMILPRQQRRTESNYLDLTLMKLQDSRIPINHTRLMMHHLLKIRRLDNKGHALAYRFWLGAVFEHLHLPIQIWQTQATEDVIGTVN